MRFVQPSNVHDIVRDLAAGKAVVFPTETSYGLGCDARNQNAVDKIFFIKGRPADKPLLIVVADTEMAKKYLVWNELTEKIANKYWPGPCTVIGEYNKSEPLAKGVVGRDNTVAIRVSSFPFLNKLSAEAGFPIVATSANVSDEENLYDDKKIFEVFSARHEQPDLVVSGGQLPKVKPTTIVRVSDNNFEIVRQGELNIEL
jgi:L-threonylcarbamoyladenylate synthase